MVDTGDRSAFTLYKKFSEQSGLRKLFNGQPEVISGYGVGGPIPAKLGTLDAISLSDQVQLKGILTRLPSTQKGAFVETDLAGTLVTKFLTALMSSSTTKTKS